MPEQQPQWQIPSPVCLPEWFTQAVATLVPGQMGLYLAQVIWQRGIQDPEQLTEFLYPDRYQPSGPEAFGPEIEWAVARLNQAHNQQETIAIWGDFDADGVTATAVLWDGLGQFFSQGTRLFYFIPNRLTESHGLSKSGLDRLKAQGVSLIVTCDTGSTNLAEVEYAASLGIDVIITDHHTLPAHRPPVTAILNPRYLPATHPLAHLSGVAVAYKLVEALYREMPAQPRLPLEHLLDLVAIGLIADLVELQGDCRYLAQQGIAQLQKQNNPATATRPGVAKLLELCKRSGDRPTDISFGLGPRINAVSRIQGDAHFCVELLTSQDKALCRHLAEATELANSRRKALQKDVTRQVRDHLMQLDLSTTGVIVLADPQWPVGVLGLVAGQIAQEYGRPTILLSTEETPGNPCLARGSARSANKIDFYQLVQQQQHLLYRFGGHPYAAGLSLPIDNIPLLAAALNQQMRQMADTLTDPVLAIDLGVTVADLGKDLFQALKRLEPCGMGNPVPKLLLQNCWFQECRNRNIQDWKGGKVQYIKTEFELRDDSTPQPFPGVWWGHYRDEIPGEPCDAVVELDFNSYNRRYEVRLIAVRPRASGQLAAVAAATWILDERGRTPSPATSALVINRCPASWAELQPWFRRSRQEDRPLAIAYSAPANTSPEATWQQLAGIAKYLSRTGKPVLRQQLLDRLEIGDRALQQGILSLNCLGFSWQTRDHYLQVTWQEPTRPTSETVLRDRLERFITTVREERFRRQYFYQVPLATIQAVANQISNNSLQVGAPDCETDGNMAGGSEFR